ncbi:MAG: hypothetical protein ACSHXK_16040 [Oceanococcus sp.]
MADKPKDTADDGLQPPSLTIDWELYGKYLEDSDLTDDQKREFIETLWSIVVAFVDLGFGVHPVQQACEQNQKSGIPSPDDLLHLINTYQTQEPDNNVNDAPSHSVTKEES